jgi:glutaredoxin
MNRVLDQKDAQPPHTLFSSHECKYCKLFLKELTTTNLIDSFNIVDVMKTPTDVSKVKVIPTIVINHQRVLSGRDAFSWLQNEKKNIVLGVNNYDVKDGFAGASSAYTYIDEQVSENVMSGAFAEIPIEERSSGETHVQQESSGGSMLQDRIEAMKKERGMVS